MWSWCWFSRVRQAFPNLHPSSKSLMRVPPHLSFAHNQPCPVCRLGSVHGAAQLVAHPFALGEVLRLICGRCFCAYLLQGYSFLSLLFGVGGSGKEEQSCLCSVQAEPRAHLQSTTLTPESLCIAFTLCLILCGF
jgi:hypothetical protein